jgi:hypothetical protein
MSWQPKYILYGAVLAIAGMAMFSAIDERVKLAILLALFVVVAVTERRI